MSVYTSSRDAALIGARAAVAVGAGYGVYRAGQQAVAANGVARTAGWAGLAAAAAVVSLKAVQPIVHRAERAARRTGRAITRPFRRQHGRAGRNY